MNKAVGRIATLLNREILALLFAQVIVTVSLPYCERLHLGGADEMSSAVSWTLRPWTRARLAAQSRRRQRAGRGMTTDEAEDGGSEDAAEDHDLGALE